MAQESDLLVSLENIGKSYPMIDTSSARITTLINLIRGKGIDEKFTALENISLNITRGESWGIIGENGAGKSTLLKIVAGVVKPSHGTVTVNGKINALLELGTGFHPEYTGRENIFLAAALMGWSHSETQLRVAEILEFADIDDHIDFPVKTYSSGMVVRLGFAVATALRPDLLVTDEVLAVGDESFQKKCLHWIESFLSNGGTLMLCSHSMYHIQRLCQKAIWVHHGRNQMQGDVHQVTQSYLAYHEEKNRKVIETGMKGNGEAPYPTMLQLSTQNKDGNACHDFAMGEAIDVRGIYRAPNDLPAVLMVGAIRIDGTPIYGTFSPQIKPFGNKIGPYTFAFSFLLSNNSFLPGKYRIRAHTLDEHGLRLFDTKEVEFVIAGETEEHGFVRLAHEWRLNSNEKTIE